MVMNRELNTAATFWVVRVLGMVLMMLLLARLASAQTTGNEIPGSVDKPTKKSTTGNNGEPELDILQAVPPVTTEAKVQTEQVFFAPAHPGNKTAEEGKAQAEQNKLEETPRREKQPVIPPE